MRRPKSETPNLAGLGAEDAADEGNVKTDSAPLGEAHAKILHAKADALSETIPLLLTVERKRATKVSFCGKWLGVLAIRRGESFELGGGV